MLAASLREQTKYNVCNELRQLHNCPYLPVGIKRAGRCIEGRRRVSAFYAFRMLGVHFTQAELAHGGRSALPSARQA